jgi:hypothetical protein
MTIKEINEGFDNLFKEITCIYGEESKWQQKSISQLKSFYTTAYAELIKEAIPENGIMWMQEGNKHKDRKGYTAGFNAAIDTINSNFRKAGIKI